MASALRFCASKLLARNSVAGLCKSAPGSSLNVTKIQVALISGKAMRNPDKKRPAPYPYETKEYNLWHGLFDSTLARMDENSKVVVVEGPIASGKTVFAEALAEDLDMKYFPAVTMDMEYINPYGWDMRQLDPKLPPACRSYDVKNFCEDPHHLNCANYQVLMYRHRYSQYIDALAHLFSTGQGVVLERCCYSDFVFMEAMYNAGYISKLARGTYEDLVGLTMPEILLPHLVIYLDVPAAAVKDKIQKRGIPYEVNSKVFTPEYLECIENKYKQDYLKAMAKHAHILIYDWTDGGDSEVVVEDIERLNFDLEKNEGKFQAWRFWDDDEWGEERRLFADYKINLMNNFNLGHCDAPELNLSGADSKILYEVWADAPGEKFIKGFNADMGDKGLLFKNYPSRREYRIFNIH